MAANTIVTGVLVAFPSFTWNAREASDGQPGRSAGTARALQIADPSLPHERVVEVACFDEQAALFHTCEAAGFGARVTLRCESWVAKGVQKLKAVEVVELDQAKAAARS